MPFSKFEDDVVDQLDGVGGLTKGTNLFAGPRRPVDRTVGQAVFVTPTSGDPPRHYRASTEVRYPAARVLVRSTQDTYETGLTLARLVLETLHRNPPAGYIELQSRTSDPLPLGQTEDGYWEWSINILGTIDE